MTFFPSLNQNISDLLLPRENLALASLGMELRELLQSSFLEDFDAQKVKAARLILDICAYDARQTKNLLFKQLIHVEPQDLPQLLERIQTICKKGWAYPFFSCAETISLSYYSTPTIVKMVADFESFLLNNQTVPSTYAFFAYDSGGQQQLAELSKAPTITMISTPQTLKTHLKEQTSFKGAKSLAIQYASSLPESQRASLQIYAQIFNWIRTHHALGEYSEAIKSALVKQIIHMTTCEEGSLPEKVSLQDLKEIVKEWVICLDVCGEEMLLLYCEAHCSQRLSQNCSIFKKINYLVKEQSQFIEVAELLEKFKQHQLTSHQLVQSLENLFSDAFKTADIKEDDLQPILNRFSGKNDRSVVYPLPPALLKKITNQYAVVQNYCKLWKGLRLTELVSLADDIQNQGTTEENIIKLIAIGRLALYIKHHIYLNHNQVLTVLGKLCYTQGCVGQVKAGQGKSLIVCLLAFILAKQKKRFFVTSTDPILVTRDWNQSLDFFTAFSLTSGHICENQPNKTAFTPQILFGTSADFKFAIMREMLYGQELFANPTRTLASRRFDAIIVDEFDTLFDTAKNGARLAYPADQTYAWIYLPIYCFAEDQAKSGQVLPTLALLPLLKTKLKEQLPAKFHPALNKLTDQQLASWLGSALHAILGLKPKDHYVITEKGKKRKIEIVDAAHTGRIHHQSRWSNGIHEFVEVKHDIDPEQESVTPLDLSDFVFFQKFDLIYGLTGTLGDFEERSELKEIYGIDTFDVPTYHPIIRKDAPFRFFNSKNEYLAYIVFKVKCMIQQGRPVLLLAETIKESENFKQELERHGIDQLMVLNEVQEEEEEQILKKAGHEGWVTIATNTAGRGTDIKLTPGSRDNGGLHVLLTFYPDSSRVENQNRARAGRQDQPGSSEGVAYIEDIQLPNGFSIDHPDVQKAILEHYEQNRVEEAKIRRLEHLLHARAERYLFNLIEQFFIKLRQFKETVESEAFLSEKSKLLANRKIFKEALIPENITHQEDISLSLQALSLLQDRDTNPARAKALIMAFIKRVESKVINFWSLEFYSQASGLITSANFTESAILQKNLPSILDALVIGSNNATYIVPDVQEIKQLVMNESEGKLNQVCENINDLFDQKKPFWEKFLKPDGSGVFELMREVTGKTLSGL